jgi:hypothetical protein
MAMERSSFETLEGHGSPTVRQLSVFLENRVGQLLRLTQVIERRKIKILALSVSDSVDFAVVRLLFDNPDEAAQVLRAEDFAISLADVLVVKLPRGDRGLLTIFSALLSAEVNISYAYPLLPAWFGPAIALSVDNIEISAETLRRKKFVVLTEPDLHREP